MAVPGAPGAPAGDKSAISIQTPGGPPAGGFGGSWGGGGWGGGAGGWGGGGGFNFDAMIEARFKQYDANGDGILNFDEMPESLRAERDKWDTNKDGFIDLAEFKEYSKARMQQWQQDRAGNSSGGSGDPFEPDNSGDHGGDRKPTIYRMSNLPKELAWMKDLDTDGDNQIGLYEWKNSGRPLQEFFDYDRNKDGFVTIEEAMFYHKLKYPTVGTPDGGSPGGSRFPNMAMGQSPFGPGAGMPTQFQMPPGGNFNPMMMQQWPNGGGRGDRGRGPGGFNQDRGPGQDRGPRMDRGPRGQGMDRPGGGDNKGYGKSKGERNRGG
jgi:hypothetical protein